METKQNEKLSNYLTAIKKAKGDNEKFASLLMVAKVTKGENCSKQDMRDILEAIGPKFMTRLIKTKTIPEGCSSNIFKSVALSVLSALCAEPDVARSPVVKENIEHFNTFILLDPGSDDEEGRCMVDDTYLCLNSLCRTVEGIQSLQQEASLAALCQAVISQAYGHEKAQDLLYLLVSYAGPEAWRDCEESFTSLLQHLSHVFATNMDQEKFDICKTLVFLLSYTPENLNKSEEPPWLPNIVTGLADILKSKIGPSQREPALRLVSTLVHVCGIYCILPPFTPDCKLFLLTTHLCCVEVRMVLEAYDLKEASKNGQLLSSCYSFLESIISHLSQGPSLHLEDRQIIQLHAAMLGAFTAVLHFLKRVAADTSIQWNSIILATVRVLSAWLAEETTALKEDVYDLIPFLVQISKMCIPPEGAYNKTELKEKISGENDNSPDNVEAKINRDINDLENVHKASDIQETDTERITKDIQDIDVRSESDTSSTNKDKSDSAENQKDIPVDESIESLDAHSYKFKEKQNTDTSEQADNVQRGEGDELVPYRSRAVLDGMMVDKEVLTEEELADLHLNADIFHFLLPGLCHLTAEDKSRHILLECGALDILDLYMWRQWEKFVHVPAARDIQAGWSSLVILCNIFLNLIIVEPAIITEKPMFAHVLLLVVKGIEVVEKDEDFMVLWSHMITLGLMLLRQLHAHIDEGLESESISRFFVSTVRFLNGAYTANYEKKNRPYLDIAPLYQKTWDQISQTWFLSMQALCACIPLYPNLPTVILGTGWIPSLLKITLDVKGNGIAEETRSCFVMLLTSLARASPSACTVIQEKGGNDFARIYKTEELKEALTAN